MFIFGKKSQCRKKCKGPFGEKIFRKKSHNAEKLKGGTLRGFSTSILTQNSKKIEGEPFGEFFSEKKSRSAEKKMKEDSLVSPGMVCYAENMKNFFGSVR